MIRASLALLFALWLAAPAAAQTQEEGEMRLYIQRLEEQVRQLTGENERLTYDLNQLRVQQGLPPIASVGPDQTGTVAPQTGVPEAIPGAIPGATPGVPTDGQLVVNAPVETPPPVDGQLDVPPALPPVADAQAGAPIDLSSLANGTVPEFVTPAPGTAAAAGADGSVQVAGAPMVAPPVTALSGSSRDEYDLAYGYILTGDYNLAEDSFKVWLVAFPSDPLVVDAKFWLGESRLQQGEYREAANSFIEVYKMAPDGPKGPDSLLKLGISLAALGEKPTACSTFAELQKRYPQAPESITSRAHDEAARAGC